VNKLDISVKFPQRKAATYSEVSPSIHWAQFHRRTPGAKWRRRIYDFELLYVKEGEITGQLGSRQLHVQAGELLYIPAGVYHHIIVNSNPDAVFLGIHFDYFDELEIQADQDIIVKEASVQPLKFCLEPEFEHYTPLSEVPVFVPPAQSVLMMEQLIDEFTQRPPGFEIACRSLMQQILLLLWRGQVNSKKKVHSKYGEPMLRLAAMMEIRFEEDWSYDALARQVNLQADYFAKLFKEVIGMPPNKYLQFIRHREARRLLRETDQTIEVIGERVGYKDLHYFSRIFHKWEGVSPRAYRKLSRMY